jgi:DNA-binding Xre family transcriptional regulator
MSATKKIQNRAGVRKALFSQAEAMGDIVDSSGLSGEDRLKVINTLRSFLIAEGDDKEEWRVTLLEMLDPDGAMDLDPISLDKWELLNTDIEQANRELDKHKAEFGKRLKELMKDRNVGQKDLAAMLGVTQPCISQFAAGKHKPQPETLSKLAKALGCKVSDLWPD